MVGGGEVEHVDGEGDAGVADADSGFGGEDQEESLVVREGSVQAQALLAFVLGVGERDVKLQ